MLCLLFAVRGQLLQLECIGTAHRSCLLLVGRVQRISAGNLHVGQATIVPFAAAGVNAIMVGIRGVTCKEQGTLH